MATVDPRSIYSRLRAASAPDYGTPRNSTTDDPTWPNPGSKPPTTSDPGTGLPSAGDRFPNYATGGAAPGGSLGDDPWATILAALQPYGNTAQIEANRAKLDPMLSAARSWVGDNNIMKTLQYNPMKAFYTMMSYLTGTPYYDKSDSGGWNLFKIPGFDYGTADDSWGDYVEGSHSYRT